MKTLKILSIAMIVMALAVFGVGGALAQKKAPEKPQQETQQGSSGKIKQKTQSKAALAQAQHQAAVEALDGRRFVIRAEQLFFPYGRYRAKTTQSGYISMQGDKVVFNIDRSAFVNGNIGINPLLRDNVAEMTTGPVKVNGDREYTLNIKDEDSGFSMRTLRTVITLYGGSNQCSIRVDLDLSRELMSIRGRVYPAQELDVD